jgi:hypothetical protein
MTKILKLTSKKLQNIDLNLLASPSKITEIHASHNYIASLENLTECKKLSKLSLAFNQIQNITAFFNLPSPSLLKQLKVKGNAFTKDPNYKAKLLRIFPNLDQLDDLKLSSSIMLELKKKQNCFEILSRKIVYVTNLIQSDTKILNKFTKYIENKLNGRSAKELTIQYLEDEFQFFYFEQNRKNGTLRKKKSGH